MPGIYDLATASLQMKEYVDLEGSGSDNTIITSTNTTPEAGNDNCDSGTVLMANNSTIRSVKIVNNPTVGGMNAAALVFKDVKAKADGVSVLIGDDVSTAVFRNIGICVYGTAANVKLNDVYVEAHNGRGQSNTITKMEGSVLVITNSTLVASNTIGNTKMINSWDNGSGIVGRTTVINCTFEGTSPWVEALFLSNNDTSMLNSVITMNVAAGTAPSFFNNSNLKIVNTKFISNSTVGVVYSNMLEGAAQISNSILHGYSGDLEGTSAKLFNNCDENLNPIINQ
jgi:hypothetical protein